MAGPSEDRRSVLITGYLQLPEAIVPLGNHHISCSPGGIGNSLAREFHRNGLRVFATARNKDSIADLNELGIETLSLVVDNEESVRACFEEVKLLLTEEKGLDYLVNNAGQNYTVPALDVDMAEVRATFETNFFGVVYICKTFVPLLIKSQGTIVQIGSVAGIIPYVFGSIYNASKAALHQYSDTLRVELAPFGVKVTTIVTGGVQSRIARTARTLPSDSLYQPLTAEYTRRVTHSQDGALPNEKYARSVVSQVLYGSAPWRWLLAWRRFVTPKKWIWVGNRASLIWLLQGGWAWIGLFQWVMTRMFNLKKLRKAFQNNKI